MDETIKNRIEKYCKYIDTSIRKFTLNCGLSNGYFKDSTKTISPEYQKKISDRYPELNISWVLTGDGSMLRSELLISDDVVQMPREVFDQISRLTETVLSQQRTIESLTIDDKKTDIAGSA